MKKYFLASSAGIQKHFTYPMRFGIWILTDISRMAVLPFLWLAIYGERQMVAGFSRADIVTYYLIITLISFFSISHSSGYITEDIRNGRLNTFLLRPYSYICYNFMSESGYKILSGSLGVILFITLSRIAPSYIAVPDSLVTILFFAVFIVIARVLSFSFEVVVGLTTFWFGRIGAANHFRFMMEQVFGGELAPLVFFPLFVQKIAAWLPFQYLFYLPTKVFLGHFSLPEMLQYAGIGLGWVGVFFGIIWLLWWRGLKVYEGVGI